MFEGEAFKYGWIRGGKTSYVVPVASAETIRRKSGRFVTNDASGVAEIADAGDSTLWGFVESGKEEALSAQTEMVMIVDLTAVFRVPVITGTYVANMLGETCDLVRATHPTTGGTTLIQGVDLTATGEDVVMLVGGDLVNNEWVDVMMIAAKMYNNGVTD